MINLCRACHDVVTCSIKDLQFTTLSFLQWCANEVYSAELSRQQKLRWAATVVAIMLCHFTAHTGKDGAMPSLFQMHSHFLSLEIKHRGHHLSIISRLKRVLQVDVESSFIWHCKCSSAENHQHSRKGNLEG